MAEADKTPFLSDTDWWCRCSRIQECYIYIYRISYIAYCSSKKAKLAQFMLIFHVSSLSLSLSGSFYGVDICTVFTCVPLTAKGCQISISHAPCRLLRSPLLSLSPFANIVRPFYLKWTREKPLSVSGFTYPLSLSLSHTNRTVFTSHRIDSIRFISIWIDCGALTTHFSFKLLSFLSGKWCQISINF